MLNAAPTIPADPSTATPGADRLARLACPQVAAVVTFAALAVFVLISTLAATGGTFAYSLDDPYIHLALAERLALGHYGINLREVTSPSSSILWPFLLVPGAGTALHPYVPLILNLLLGAATAWLFGQFAAGLPLPAGDPTTPYARYAVAVLLVPATNLVGLAFTGMEHNLQVLLTVGVVLGMLQYVRGQTLPTWAIVLAAIGPAVRYELFAVTAAVAVLLIAERRWRPLAMMAVGSLVLPAAFALFLVANGNSPLPNSVMLKIRSATIDNGLPFPFSHILPPTWNYGLNVKLAAWLMIAGLATVSWHSNGRLRWFCGAIAMTGVLHMLVGRFGWFARYEIYVMAACALAVLWVLAERAPKYIAAVTFTLALLYYPIVLTSPAASLNIYEQQFQMHRFVSEFYRRPVAVNDLGWVSYRIDPKIYILDLWGLASNEALIKARAQRPEWLDDITRRHDTGLAMIYDEWFPRVPTSWTRVGQLVLSKPAVTAADDKVSFYVTATGNKAEIVGQLEAFKPTLPRGVTFKFDRN